ncbi:hypothetical protein C8R45DRAFT_1207516 [Mycena sanguinolenta]|nr:hypothetical protein C8R45DRAFT_1207516 [Mycena sanguinolenta]
MYISKMSVEELRARIAKLDARFFSRSSMKASLSPSLLLNEIHRLKELLENLSLEHDDGLVQRPLDSVMDPITRLPLEISSMIFLQSVAPFPWASTDLALTICPGYFSGSAVPGPTPNLVEYFVDTRIGRLENSGEDVIHPKLRRLTFGKRGIPPAHGTRLLRRLSLPSLEVLSIATSSDVLLSFLGRLLELTLRIKRGAMDFVTLTECAPNLSRFEVWFPERLFVEDLFAALEFQSLLPVSTLWSTSIVIICLKMAMLFGRPSSGHLHPDARLPADDTWSVACFTAASTADSCRNSRTGDRWDASVH